MSRKINTRDWARFALAMRFIREDFPEHKREIDKCIYDVGQKLENCDDPNCTCRMNFENFHSISNQTAEQEI